MTIKSINRKINHKIYCNNNILWYIFILIILSLQIYLAVTHQHWRDEWQALQISIQSPSITAMFENLRYEGHPPLWYLILRVARNFVPAIYVLNFVQIFISVITQIIIQFYAPFNRIQRLLIGSSVFILFEFGVISRSLSLGVLLIIAYSAFRHTKWSWLALAALPMVDFIFGLISVALIAIAWRERRMWGPGIAVWLISSLFAAWSVRPAPDMITAASLNSPIVELVFYLSRMSILLIPLQMDGLRFEWDNPIFYTISPIIGLLFLIFSYYNLRKNSINTVIFFFIVISFGIFSIFIYPLQIRHLELLAVLLIIFKWYDVQNGEQLILSFRIWLFIIAFLGIVVAITNIVQPFNVSNQVAHYIVSNNLKNKHWAAFPAPRAAGVSALLDMEFHSFEGNCTQSFTRWNQPISIQNNVDLRKKLKSVANNYGRFYLLTNFQLSNVIYRDIVTQLSAFPAGYDGESYYIYIVESNIPESSLRPPKCEPQDRLPLTAWSSGPPISHL